ncbi:MAG: TlpA disulfide reductase family protein [Methylococcales bacterium]|nr:TlpA disulfide reductase family protein [Methylococcales bacterium]
MPEQFPPALEKMRHSVYRYILLASFLLILAFFSITSINRLSTGAPDETFTTITGKKIALKDLRGKPVIVTFWATDCPGCMKEIPHLLDLYKQYHKQGLEIIAVAMYYDPPNHVVSMANDLQLPYDVALDLKTEHAHAFGDVQLIPSSFLISPDGLIDLKKTGSFDPVEMKSRIETFTLG